MAKELKIELKEPCLVVVFGKAGVGKTLIASEIAQRLQATKLSSDDFRRTRFGASDYRSWHSAVAMIDVMRRAQNLLTGGARSLVLDATFSKEFYRQDARELGKRNGRRLVWVEVVSNKSDSKNINGPLVAREADCLDDVPERVVVDNSDWVSWPKEKKVKLLVDQLFLDPS